MSRTVALLLLTTLLGCAGADAHVVAECVPTGPPVLLRAPLGRERPMGFGVLDGQLLLLHAEALESVESPAWRIVASWHSMDGTLLAEPEDLGVSKLAIRTRLLARDGALHGQLWVDPASNIPAREPDEVLAMWEFGAPGEHMRHRVRLPVSRTPVCVACGRASLAFSGGGLDAGGGRLPAALTSIAVASAISGVPFECMSTRAYYRPWVFTAEGGAMVQWWEDERTCALHDWDVQASNVELVTLDGEFDLGLLMRLGTGGPYGNVHYVRLHDGVPVGRPRRVGGTWTHFTVGAGYQPEATRVGRHILFQERSERTTNGCQVLRRIDFDGHGGAETPWQLRCRHHDSFYTAASELESLPVDVGRAGELGAMVYAERTSWSGASAAYLTPLTSNVAFDEGIYLTLLDESGRRASDIVRVTVEQSTALPDVPRTPTSGPTPSDFSQIATATEGSSIYVLWTDRRPDAPGRYVRRFDCAPAGRP
ncbi:MAG: hypothetical protein GXP55_12190 [Deltaproteobacteria bacterium]|nr:hypothetical protein [Deltaproteobacteria bacterium]